MSAPNLKVMERVWRLLKQYLARHRLEADVNGLVVTAETLLGQLEARFPAHHPPAIRLIHSFRESA